MERTVWYSLGKKGSELSPDANFVMCKDKETIAHLRIQVHQANTNTLAGVDPSNLEILDDGESEAKIGRTKLSDCKCFQRELPFRIFYQGIPTLHAYELRHLSYCV